MILSQRRRFRSREKRFRGAQVVHVCGSEAPCGSQNSAEGSWRFSSKKRVPPPRWPDTICSFPSRLRVCSWAESLIKFGLSQEMFLSAAQERLEWFRGLEQ